MSETNGTGSGGATKKIMEQWWGKAFGGILFWGLGFWTYSDFTKLESGEVNEIRVHRLIGALYDSLGKWPIVAGFGIAGIAFFGWGAKQLLSKSES